MDRAGTGEPAGTGAEVVGAGVSRRLRGAAVAALLLGALKAAAGWWTGSLALLASALDSLLDAGISLANAAAARAAARPADRDHAYGHGKFEPLAAFLQGLVLIGIAAWILAAAVGRLWSGRAEVVSGPATVAAVVSLVGTLGIVLYLRRTPGASRDSLILRTDLLHYAMDFANTVAVVVGLVLTLVTGLAGFDAAASILVAAAIVWQARQNLAEAIAELTDAALPAEVAERVGEVVRRHPTAIGFHDLRTRKAGPTRFISLHLELPPDLPFLEAHRVAEEVREALERAIPGAWVFVHADPYELEIDGRPRRGAEVP